MTEKISFAITIAIFSSKIVNLYGMFLGVMCFFRANNWRTLRLCYGKRGEMLTHYIGNITRVEPGHIIVVVGKTTDAATRYFKFNQSNGTSVDLSSTWRSNFCIIHSFTVNSGWTCDWKVEESQMKTSHWTYRSTFMRKLSAEAIDWMANGDARNVKRISKEKTTI